MYLYDTNSYYEDNSKALAAVRRMIVIMRLLGNEARPCARMGVF